MKLIAGAVLGALIGALLGGLAFGSLSADSTATAFIRITPPVDFTALAGGAAQTTPNDQDVTENYVAGEVSYLAGEGFAQAVGRKLALSGPASIIVSQAGGSSAVTISNSSSSADEARRTVQAAIDIYGQQLAQRADQQLRAILPALDQWQLADAADPARMRDITALRDSIRLQAAQASVVVVLQPPTVNDPSVDRWLIGALLGGVLGAALVVLLVMRRSRRSGQPTLVPTVAEAVDGVLVPSVNIRKPWSSEQASLARTLYTQCVAAVPSRVIVVLGATEDSGTSVVASMFEFAAAERVPVGGADQHATQIIGAGAIGVSAEVHQAIDAATAIVVVVRIDHDTAAQALTTCSAAAAGGKPVLAVFTYRPWWATLLGGPKRNRPAAEQTPTGRHGASAD
jgi:hypothetical protein